MATRSFEPQQLVDGHSAQWSFLNTKIHEVFLTVIRYRLTGALELGEDKQDEDKQRNRLFFREGQAVGVLLQEIYAPLGQLLLELGYIDSAAYLAAKQQVDSHGRMPGQVYIDAGLISTAQLRQVLLIQATRRAQRFTELCQGHFVFKRGSSFLADFSGTLLDVDGIIQATLLQDYTEAEHAAYLDELGDQQLKVDDVPQNLDESVCSISQQEQLFEQLTDWTDRRTLTFVPDLATWRLGLMLRLLSVRDYLKLRHRTDDATGNTSIDPPLKNTKSAIEVTERVSMEALGWDVPNTANEEHTEVKDLPSIIVNYDALGQDDSGDT